MDLAGTCWRSEGWRFPQKHIVHLALACKTRYQTKPVPRRPWSAAQFADWSITSPWRPAESLAFVSKQSQPHRSLRHDLGHTRRIRDVNSLCMRGPQDTQGLGQKLGAATEPTMEENNCPCTSAIIGERTEWARRFHWTGTRLEGRRARVFSHRKKHARLLVAPFAPTCTAPILLHRGLLRRWPGYWRIGFLSPRFDQWINGDASPEYSWHWSGAEAQAQQTKGVSRMALCLALRFRC